MFVKPFTQGPLEGYLGRNLPRVCIVAVQSVHLAAGRPDLGQLNEVWGFVLIWTAIDLAVVMPGRG